MRAGHSIHETAREQVGDDDLVTDLEFVHVSERFAVGGAVTGNGNVAQFSGHGRVRIVTRAFLQVGGLHAGHHELLDADGRYLDDRDRITFVDHHGFADNLGGDGGCHRTGRGNGRRGSDRGSIGRGGRTHQVLKRVLQSIL